jgi:hypothetical protein
VLGARYVTFADATLFHKPECLLATGKEPREIEADEVTQLRPCPVCDPQS